jgi:hypothetical protein
VEFHRRRHASRFAATALALSVALALAGCGAASTTVTSTVAAAGGGIPKAHPQAVEPTAGMQAATSPAAQDPVGDPTAHAMPLSEVNRLLKEEHVVVKADNATYINPLQYVNHWERTDQGVDANMPVGAPIFAPSPVKILAVIPNWYAGQPLVYFELLDGRQAGRVQYVAEQITDIAQPGMTLQKGQVIARYAASGTGIEYGWSTLKGVTLARATTGYEEGQVTPAGVWMRNWLNALGANAGSS